MNMYSMYSIQSLVGVALKDLCVCASKSKLQYMYSMYVHCTVLYFQFPRAFASLEISIILSTDSRIGYEGEMGGRRTDKSVKRVL